MPLDPAEREEDSFVTKKTSVLLSVSPSTSARPVLRLPTPSVLKCVSRAALTLTANVRKTGLIAKTIATAALARVKTDSEEAARCADPLNPSANRTERTADLMATAALVSVKTDSEAAARCAVPPHLLDPLLPALPCNLLQNARRAFITLVVPRPCSAP